MNSSIPIFLSGAKIRILEKRGKLTRPTINRIWRINDLRGELVHSYSPNVLRLRKRFQASVMLIIQRLSRGGKLAISSADQNIIDNISTSKTPAESCLSDCELVVTASQFIEHLFSKYYNIKGKDMSLGKKPAQAMVLYS